MAASLPEFLLRPVFLLGILLGAAAPEVVCAHAGMDGADAQAAQPPSAEQERDPAVLRGRVVRGDGAAGTGVAVLHEVSLTGAGQLDSVPVAGDGSFTFELPGAPDPESGAVYFASTVFEDVLYFGVPVNSAAQLDSTYLIHVYETRPAPPRGADFPVAARNLFLQDAGAGWSAVDLIQIRNEGLTTLVAAGEEAVWSYPLLGGARDFQAEEDIAGGDLRFADGRVYISGPVPPGERLYAVRYIVPSYEFVAPLPGVTETMELLVREPAPATSVTGLAPLPPVEVEAGVTYRRYAAAELADDAVGVILAEEPFVLPFEWMALVVSLFLVGLATYAVRGRSYDELSQRAQERRRLLREVAILDEAYTREGKTGAKARKAYRRRRNRLMARLTLGDEHTG